MIAPIANFKCAKYPNGSVTQWFGGNPELYNNPRNTVRTEGHNGIDIVAPHGTPMRAVCTGTIVDVKRDDTGYGRHVRILADKKEGIYQPLWVYGHCNDIFVEVGDKVEEGQIIATMGNTGFVISGATPYWEHNPFAGTHLHLGKRLVQVVQNGFSYEGSDISFKVKGYNNGYLGYVDFKDELCASEDGVSYRSMQLSAISILNYLKRMLSTGQSHKN